MTYHDYLPARLGPDGVPVFPLAFHDRPRGMSAFGQDPKGLEAKPASPARKGAASFLRNLFTRPSRSEAEARIGA